jgi:hypothetical protein
LFADALLLFYWLVVGQVLAANPAHPVRGPKHVMRRGKTPEIRFLMTPRFNRALGACRSGRQTAWLAPVSPASACPPPASPATDIGRITLCGSTGAG